MPQLDLLTALRRGGSPTVSLVIHVPSWATGLSIDNTKVVIDGCFRVESPLRTSSQI